MRSVTVVSSFRGKLDSVREGAPSELCQEWPGVSFILFCVSATLSSRTRERLEMWIRTTSGLSDLQLMADAVGGSPRSSPA